MPKQGRGLTLSRTVDEAITVEHAGETLQLIVNYVRGRRVGIKLVAPQSFRLLRAELTERPDDVSQDEPRKESA